MGKVMSSTKIAAKRENVVVEINNEVVTGMAASLARNLILSNPSIANIFSMEDAQDCFTYALSVILSQDSGARPSRDSVPTFMSDLCMSLNAFDRGVRILVDELVPCERPDSYDTFLDVCLSMNIPVGKVLSVRADDYSDVLKCGVLKSFDVPTLVSTVPDASLDVLVVRAMLTVSEEEQDKISRIVGHMDNMYMSRDELVREWACSQPMARRE